MGFYGKVFYQLANAFGKFGIKNNGLTKENFPLEIPEETTSSAIGLEATYNFDTGNRWIQLIADNENGAAEIYHASVPDTLENIQTTPIAAIDVVSSSEIEAEQLGAGDCIAVPSLACDAAGHIVGITETNYFKLPMNTVEADISNLQSTINDLLDNDKIQDDNISTLLTDYGVLQDQTHFLGEKDSFTTIDSDDTVTDALGSIVDLREHYRTSKNDMPTEEDYNWKEDETGILNISKAILDLDTRVKQLKKITNVIGADTNLQGLRSTIIPAVNDLTSSVASMAIGYQDMLRRIVALENTINKQQQQ